MATPHLNGSVAPVAPCTPPSDAEPAERSVAIVRIAFVSTYPPRRCGIATFTHNLAAATGSREVVALHPAGQTLPYPIEVHHRIRRDEPGDYPHAARSLDACVDVVSIQHADGLWGGDDGSHLIDFVRALRVPSVATLHAVLPNPTPGQRAVVTELVAHADAAVVLTRAAGALLTSAYGVDAGRIRVIPHGVPDLPLVDPDTVKPALGVAGRTVALSFGLLEPGKGFELAIDALPAVVAENPTLLYAIVGATHPDTIRQDGEAYRTSLVERVRAHGLGKHVQFVDRFVGRVELTRWLEAADVFVTPSSDPGRTASGTLAYAMGAGRAIVSTADAAAADLLADGRGMLVQPGSAAALAAAMNQVLGDPELRAVLGRRAYERSRGAVWSAVAAEYRDLFARAAERPRRATTLGALAPLATVVA
ncbi:MAG TPA: glycosyltransferase [Candidatus Limnocylindrales bacterium]|nr:glycosyltransferase [Candidatus Limnocylindrales bacterium]